MWGEKIEIHEVVYISKYKVNVDLSDKNLWIHLEL